MAIKAALFHVSLKLTVRIISENPLLKMKAIKYDQSVKKKTDISIPVEAHGRSIIITAI